VEEDRWTARYTGPLILVDVEIIWDIVENKLPVLDAQIIKIIEEA